MRKNLLPGLGLNPFPWGKLLLTVGLLLVFVQGLLQLYVVQNFFFPDRYRAIKLNLINQEYVRIDRTLTSLQNQLTILTAVQQARGKPVPVPSSQPLAVSPTPLPALDARGYPDSSWQAAIRAAQKKRMYAVRKLSHIGLILQSMQQNLEVQLSGIDSASARKPEMEKTLQQIRESRALWQTYNDHLHDLSIKLNKIAGSKINQQASTIPRNKIR